MSPVSSMFQPNQDEDAVEFANRVKRKIAMAGGLVDLVWDGNLKRQVGPWHFYSARKFMHKSKKTGSSMEFL